MPPRIKEEERVEKIIRDLLKQPENKRCINCNILGPQYVCTTFWTFVCTNCSGIHREFTHRVKSVSMAKFNAEEVSALQTGGNERARQIYFKTWDSQRNFYPDGSNLKRLREFIRHVYVERKFAGGNSSDRLSMGESDPRKDSYVPRSFEKSSWGERRSFEKGGESGGDPDSYVHCSTEKSSPLPRLDVKSFKDTEERSLPRYGQENIRPGGQKGRSRRFEIVDDRFRDDGNVKRYDRYGHRGESSPPSCRKSGEMSFPEIRPLKDILGDKVPPLTIAEPPNANATNQDSTDGNTMQKGIVNLSSLIDFDDNPGPQGKLKDSNKSIEDKASAAKVNTLESLLSEYSAPVTSPSNVKTSSGAMEDLISGYEATDGGTENAIKISDSCETISAPKMDNDNIFSSNSSGPAEHITELHHQQNSSPVSNDPKPVSNVSSHKPSQVDEAGDGSMPNQRKELPADLFASDFTAVTPAVPGWQLPPHAMQFQPPPTSTAAFLNATKPSNPFDINNEISQAQATVFPSMTSFQGALPNLSSGTILQPHPSPYTISISPHAATYPINSPHGDYFRQQANSMPCITSEQGISGGSIDPFEWVNPIHAANGEESWQAAPHAPSRGVNPFG